MKKVTMQTDQKKLVLDHLGLADDFIRYHFQANSSIAGFAQEDLKQVAYLALCRAAMVYDGRASFRTFAQTVMTTALADYCRETLPEAAIISASQKPNDNSEFDYISSLPDTSAAAASSELEMWDLISSCQKRYQGVERKGLDVISLKLRGYTDAEIAQKVGRSRNQVNAWASKARKKMRTDAAVLSAI